MSVWLAKKGADSGDDGSQGEKPGNRLTGGGTLGGRPRGHDGEEGDGSHDRLVDRFRDADKERASALFGTGDKSALLVGLAWSDGLGAVFGVLSRTRPQPIAVAISLFAIVAAWATTQSATAGQTVPWLLALVPSSPVSAPSFG